MGLFGNVFTNPVRFFEKKVLGQNVHQGGGGGPPPPLPPPPPPVVHYRPDPNLESALKLVQATNEASEKRLAELKETIRLQDADYKARLRETERKLDAMSRETTKILADLASYASERKIDSFEDLKKADKKRFDAVMSIAAQTPSTPLRAPYSVVFVGNSGTGKSSLINQIVGIPGWCEVGIAQTTMEVKEHPAPNSNISFFDIPGKTDVMSYFTAAMIGLLKSCQVIGITITRTVHEVSGLCTLLDHINVPYVILVTRMDEQRDACKRMGEQKQLSGAELDAFVNVKLEAARQQVCKEVAETCKLGTRQLVFRISSLAITEFDWPRFVAYMMHDLLGRNAYLGN